MAIVELRRGGQAHDVVKKSDFGSRICNAAVWGEWTEPSVRRDPSASPLKSNSDEHFPRPLSQLSRPLPPQILILALESGYLVFLFVKEDHGGAPKTITIAHHCHCTGRNIHHQLAIDPSSRYMVTTSSNGIFVLYEFHPREILNDQYLEQGTFEPFNAVKRRPYQGIINHVTFLYPRPGDESHIILLFMMSRLERKSKIPSCRMFTYDWDIGDDLQSIFTRNLPTHRVPNEYSLPLFLVPLTLQSSLLIVCQNSIGLVRNVLAGSPHWDLLETETPEKTPWHLGLGEPVWAAWSRPFRRKTYFEKIDVIYLAREDGAIAHVEIDHAGPSVTNVGCIETTIDTAFTAAYDLYSDILIAGGMSGPGGIWEAS